MEIIEINNLLLQTLHKGALNSERKRVNFDLRTTMRDSSQRMLNALEPDTKVPIHRHLETTETVICLQGCMDVILYDIRQDEEMESHNCEISSNMIAKRMETNLFEIRRVHLCPVEGKYGVQIPIGAWHSVEVYEPSTIFEAKDGAYKG